MARDSMMPFTNRNTEMGNSFITHIRIFLPLCFLLFLCGCSKNIISHTLYNTRSPNTSYQTFTISNHAILDIQSDAANIHIHRGTVQQIQVTSTKHVANGDTITVDYSQQDDTVTITSHIQHASNNSPSGTDSTYNTDSTYMDFEITTPSSTDTRIEDIGGSVTIEDLTGQQNVTTEAGSINVVHTTLERSSHLETIAGTVTFDGKIAPQSSSIFKTTAGTIDTTLPKNAPIDVSISSMLGQVQNDFDPPPATSLDAKLRIENTTGSVLVRQQDE